MEQPDSLHDGDEDELFVQDDDASDGEDDVLESVIQQELAKFQQQQAVKYAELAASGWVALPLPSPAPVQQLLRAEAHQLDVDAPGPAEPSWHEEQRTEYIPAARPDEQYACSSLDQQQQQKQQRPFSNAASDGRVFDRPWSAAALVDGDDAEPYCHRTGAEGERVCTAADAADAAARQELVYEQAPEQDVEAYTYEGAEQQPSQEQYMHDAEAEPQAHAEQPLGEGGEALDGEEEEQQQQQQQLLLPPDASDLAANADEQPLDGISSTAGNPVQQPSHQQLVGRESSTAGDGEQAAEEAQQQQQQQQHLSDLASNHCRTTEEDPQAESVEVCNEVDAVADESDIDAGAAAEPAAAAWQQLEAGTAEAQELHDAEQPDLCRSAVEPHNSSSKHECEGTSASQAQQEEDAQQQQQQPSDADAELASAEDEAEEGAPEQQQQQQEPELEQQQQEQQQQHEQHMSNAEQHEQKDATERAAGLQQTLQPQQEQPVPRWCSSSKAAYSLTGEASTGGTAAHGGWMELPAVQPRAAAAEAAAGEAAADKAASMSQVKLAEVTTAAAGSHAVRQVDGIDTQASGLAGALAALGVQDPGSSSSSSAGSQADIALVHAERLRPGINHTVVNCQDASAVEVPVASFLSSAKVAEADRRLGLEPTPPAAEEELAVQQQHREQLLQGLQQQGSNFEPCAAVGEEDGVDDDGFVYQDDGEGSSCCSTPPASAAPVPEPAPAPAAEGPGRRSNSSAVAAAVLAAVAEGSPAAAAAAAVRNAATGLRSLSRKGRSSSGGSTGGSSGEQPQQLSQQPQVSWHPAEGITGWQTEEQGLLPVGCGSVGQHTAGHCQQAGPTPVGAAAAAAAAAKRRSSSGTMSSGGTGLQQQQQQHFHQRSDRPVHSRNRPAGASSPLLDAAKAWKLGCQLPGSSDNNSTASSNTHSIAASAYTPVNAARRSVSAGRVMVASGVRPGSAPCRQSLSAASKVSVLSSTGSSTSRAWVPGDATTTQQQLLQVYGQQQQQPGGASPRGSTSLRPVGINLQGRVGIGGWGASAAAAAAAAAVTPACSMQGNGSAIRASTASSMWRLPWQQLSAGCSSTCSAAQGADGRRQAGVFSTDQQQQQQQQQQVFRPRQCSADAMRFTAYGSALLQSSRPGSSSNSSSSRRDLRVYSSTNAGQLPWQQQQQLQQLAEGAADGAASEAAVECWCDGQFVGGLVGDSRQGEQQQQQQRAWDDSPIPMNVPKSMPIADSTQGAGQELAARASGRCTSASRAYGFGYAAGSGAAAAGRPRSAAAASMQQEAAWEAAAAGGGSNSSSGTNVYLTETLQKLKQANSCCQKLGLARQYALAPCNKPRWQLQHIAVEVWQCCQQQQQQGDAWQMKSSLTLAQFNRQAEKLLAKVAATAAAAAASQAAAAAGDAAAVAYAGLAQGGSSSNCSSLFGSPAGSRPSSPSRTRPGSASSHSVRPGSAAHARPTRGSPQSGGCCNPNGATALIAIPEASCGTSSRLSPRRRQQQQGEDSGLAVQSPSVAGGMPAARQERMLCSAGGVVGVQAARGGGMLPYAVPAWLEEHL